MKVTARHSSADTSHQVAQSGTRRRAVRAVAAPTAPKVPTRPFGQPAADRQRHAVRLLAVAVQGAGQGLQVESPRTASPATRARSSPKAEQAHHHEFGMALAEGTEVDSG